MSACIFPETKPIGLEDRPLIDGFFKTYPPEISEFTFTNLFAWRNAYKFHISVLKDCLFLICSNKAQRCEAFEPVGDPRAKIKAIQDALACGKVSRFVRISEKTAGFFEGDKAFRVLEDKNNFDYVYSTNDLVELKGAAYDAKRNFIKRFNESYKFEYKKLTPENVEVCFSFEEEWCLAKDCQKTQGLMSEREAMEEILKNFASLGAVGSMIEINGKVEAVSIGEALNPDTFVVHIEKANGAYVGIYQAINQLFCANEARGFAYINREQDLGVPGLRVAKGSYHPHHMVRKYTLELSR